jgi:hypothetical protein
MSRWLLNRGWLWWPNHGKLQWHWVVVFCSDDILTLSEVVISSTVFHWLLKWRGATDRMKFVIPWIGSTTCAIISKTIDIVHGTASNCNELPWLTTKCNDESSDEFVFTQTDRPQQAYPLSRESRYHGPWSSRAQKRTESLMPVTRSCHLLPFGFGPVRICRVRATGVAELVEEQADTSPDGNLMGLLAMEAGVKLQF